MERVIRSYLYVPGNAPDKMRKAATGEADAVVVDLEDAVPWSAKDEARAAVRRWLGEGGAPGKEVWVRINPGQPALADIRALQGVDGLGGVMLAKAESADQVRRVRDLLWEGHGDQLLVSPLLETPGAILCALDIAKLAGVQRLQIGEYDLCAEMGISPGEDEAEVAPMRNAVVMASAAAGIQPPPAPVSIEIHDTDRFRRSTELAARQGFVGRACIHPAQVAVVHEVFTPAEAAVQDARSIVALFEDHVSSGKGVLIDAKGRLLDEAVVRQARRTLSLAGGPAGDA